MNSNLYQIDLNMISHNHLFRCLGVSLILILSAACNQYIISDGEDNLEPEQGWKTNGYEYVDLGLSVCWATCNVGAKYIDEYGNVYAWGETRDKDYWDWQNYLFCKGTKDSMTKYCLQSEFGTVDNLSRLKFSDDAANFNWGGGWRLPKESEMNELITKCIWEKGLLNNTVGYFVTGPSKHKIFLPLAGRGKHGSGKSKEGMYGFYWTSNLSKTYSNSGISLIIGDSNPEISTFVRYIGLSVRPVIKNPASKDESGNLNPGDNNGNDGGNSGGNGGGTTTTGYPPEFVSYDYSTTKNSITFDFYTDVRADRATVKYGTSSPTISSSSTITNKQIRARVSGLKSGTKYYFSCTASNQYGSTRSETIAVMTDYD